MSKWSPVRPAGKLGLTNNKYNLMHFSFPSEIKRVFNSFFFFFLKNCPKT